MVLPIDGLDASRTTHRADHALIHYKLNQSVVTATPSGGDDTAALQSSLILGAGKRVYIPVGDYRINGATGLTILSGTVLEFAHGARLLIQPNALDSYAGLKIVNAEHVTIIGGEIVGERGQHTGSIGEFGYGVSIVGSKRVRLLDLITRDCWGDGLFIAGACENITLERVRSSNNRRQGMSVLQVDGLTATDCVFETTNGTNPHAGVDLEPETGMTVQHVTFDRCHFRGNTGTGLLANGLTGTLSDVQVRGCWSDGNYRGYNFANCENVQITGSFAAGNVQDAVDLQAVRYVMISQLLARNNGRAGVNVEGYGAGVSEDVSISASICTTNWRGVWIQPASSGVSVVGNRLAGNSSGWMVIDTGATGVVNYANVAS